MGEGYKKHGEEDLMSYYDISSIIVGFGSDFEFNCRGGGAVECANCSSPSPPEDPVAPYFSYRVV